MIDLTKNYRFKNVPNSEINSIVRRGNVLAIEYTRKMIMYMGDEGLSNLNNDYDLVEITPYDDWEENKEVYVTNNSRHGEPDWSFGAQKRHFSHVDDKGRPCTFKDGRSKFTQIGIAAWEFAKPAED